jgi:Tol biopolymer transport system component
VNPPDDRLDSWKEIAAYLRRDVTTVQRWEKREGMPVHRHVHDKMGSVYAFRTDLAAWAQRRRLGLVDEGDRGRAGLSSRDQPGVHDATIEDVDYAQGTLTTVATSAPQGQRASAWLRTAMGAVLAVGVTIWFLQRREILWESPIADARILQVTDFGGTEQAAAVSGDGRFVAFLSDRDGRVDVWLTRIGTGQFYNLTRGAGGELVNPSVRTLGFSPDGAFVTFWARKPGGPGDADISVWAVPLLGGQPRPYLEGVAEFDWSRDGSRLVYHTSGPGDPMFVRDPGQPPEGRQIFTAPPGLHSHFPLWSVDQTFIYFVQGSVPDRMDIWRIRPVGGVPERITYHESHVGYPVFLNPRTLIYLASDPDGSGPWLHAVDVEARRPRRVSSGIDRYTSLAASADGKRLVVTLASTKPTLWRVPIADKATGTSAARRISLTTGSGFFPRLGPGYLLYAVRNSASDSIWKLEGEAATELWSAPEARVIGAPAIAADGRRVAFSIRQSGQALLCVMNADGTDLRIVAKSLELQGAPTWAPDGRSITSAAVDRGVPHLFNVPLNGRAPTPLVREHSLDPVWSSDGNFVVFSGPDIGTTFPVKAATANAREYALPKLTLTRGARHLRFLPGRQALVVMRGDIRHKNLWLIDLKTGAERQLTDLAPDFELRDFDISPDGREAVLEQVQEDSDIVQLDMPQQ